MPSKRYIAPENSVTWTNSGGDKLLDLGGLPITTSSNIAVGAYLDRGSGSRADVYEVEFFINGFDVGPAVGGAVQLFFAQSNATTGFDGPLATDPTSSAQGTLTDADVLMNLKFAGSVIAYDTSTAQNLLARFRVRLTGRYIAPVVYNRANTLESTADTHRVTIRPIPYESQ